MKRSLPSTHSTLTPLVLAAAIGIASVARVNDGLLHPGFEITSGNTALLVTDPQNDFLSPDGVAWGVVGANVQANGTVGHRDTGMPVFVSPHYYYPHNHGWKFDGTQEKLMIASNVADTATVTAAMVAAPDR